jgi:hypothetical protein
MCPGLNLGSDTKCPNWYSLFTPVPPSRLLASALRQVKTVLIHVVPNSLFIPTKSFQAGCSESWALTAVFSNPFPAEEPLNNIYIKRSPCLRRGSRVQKFDRGSLSDSTGTAAPLTIWNKYWLFWSMPPHVPYGLCSLPFRWWPKCNRLLGMGRPWGAVTLSRWGGWWYMNMKYQEGP